MGGYQGGCTRVYQGPARPSTQSVSTQLDPVPSLSVLRQSGTRPGQYPGSQEPGQLDPVPS